MQLVKFTAGSDKTPQTGLLEQGRITPLARGDQALSDILHATDPLRRVEQLRNSATGSLTVESVQLLAPIDDHEVWGAGVTYERSKIAREEESQRAATFYDLVHRAPRPELFFKATPNRVVGPGQAIRVRHDSKWCVPEPELALVLSPKLDLVGFTIGDDVSARDIEGENPLYLPQAKMYKACCALGPGITLRSAIADPRSLAIRLEIERDGTSVFDGQTTVAKMVRTFEELIGWLGRDNCFPNGVVLLTGTGLIPPDEFSLQTGDVVKMTMDGIGTLINPVAYGDGLLGD
jgi:2-dehydro-3-deoxy-D-arabinonate dehydratase